MKGKKTIEPVAIFRSADPAGDLFGGAARKLEIEEAQGDYRRGSDRVLISKRLLRFQAIKPKSIGVPTCSQCG